MIRPVSLLLVALVISGCDRSPAPQESRPKETVAGFDNSAASQSIMQPKVIAESPPAPEPTPPPPPPPKNATVLFPDGTTLDDAARDVLDRLVADPALPPDATLVLRGHSDSPGSDEANLAVSRHRATAVRDYLREKGIAADRMSLIALGERRPVAPNAGLDGADNPDGRARNRRVDIEVVSGAVPAPAVDGTPVTSPTPTASPAAP